MTSQTSSLQTPKRDEIPVEMTWDLTLVYLDVQLWQDDFAKVESQIAQLSDLEKSLTQNSHSLLAGLKLCDEVSEVFYKLYTYAHLRQCEDNANSASQSMVGKLELLGTKLMSAVAFMEPLLLELPPEKIESMIAEEAELQLYRRYFDRLNEKRAHVRSAEIEHLLASASDALGAVGNAFNFFDNADLKFPFIPNDKGESEQLTHGNYIDFLQSNDRGVRENAFRTMHGEFYKWRNTVSALLSGNVHSHIFTAKAHHYNSALEAALDRNEVPVDVYTNLIGAVRERLPVLHRYLRLRKKRLDLSELQMWDMYVPLAGEVERPLSYLDAQQKVLLSVAPLGKEYGEIVQKSFDSRWIDVLENEGKTSGAFSDGSFATPPYMLLNWKDKLHSAFTLAHEMGHSLHSYFSRKSQPFIYSDYTIFVAEVASTLNEALLTNYMVEEAKATGDKELQFYLLNEYAERFRATLYRQTLFAEFELFMHQSAESGEALTSELMSQKYLEINRDYYGAEVNIGDVTAIEWARIPHFYYNFYVYQYATGISAATALAQQVLKEGTPAVERYLQFLCSGSSKTPVDLLKGAGVDMASPKPIHQALDV
ncbi:MAG: oligoendopeptidase F, partial [Abditibacteriaceae bacterium]